MIKRTGLVAALLLAFVSAFAQQTSSVEMADALRSSGRIYVVIATIVIVFAGLAIYLFALDRRLKRMEKNSSNVDNDSVR
ncbi:CcmD family protein [Mucilaginibacter sp.]